MLSENCSRIYYFYVFPFCSDMQLSSELQTFFPMKEEMKQDCAIRFLTSMALILYFLSLFLFLFFLFFKELTPVFSIYADEYIYICSSTRLL